jgi:hypothetical protein
MFRITGFLYFIYHPDFEILENTAFRKLDLFPSSGARDRRHTVEILRARPMIEVNTLWQTQQYGCETWTLTFKEKHKLRVFENRVLRRIFGPKRDGVTGGWRKLHN